MSDVVQTLWGFCHTLRHDGIDYGDYIEQLTYLLFLKMADERGIDLSGITYLDDKGKEIGIDCSWPALVVKAGLTLTDQYVRVLLALGRQKDLLGAIFAKAVSRFNNPVNLKKLIGMIDETEWTSLDIDIKAAAFLRLPNGTFSPYSPGTKTYVVFFTKGLPTETVWVYDARTNVPRITKKDRPLTPDHFKEFEKCFGPDPHGRAKRKPSDSKEDRWRLFSIDEVKKRDYKIDGLKWLKDESLDDLDDLPEPDELATDAIAELEAAVEELNAVLTALENGNGAEVDRPKKIAGKA
jgi:hypothetical protein